ncbi:MAG: amino acid ABC transporter ATP-binding protein, partial [Anaerotignum sp.]|nr:amino acid ABC transporter ATP-binding protein [Anaerotignum sp.]
MKKVLEINHCNKSFGDNEVLKDISLSVSEGQVVSIIGPSGSGKSTLLRCINLLENPSSGEILYHGENVVRRGFNAPAYRVRVG